MRFCYGLHSALFTFLTKAIALKAPEVVPSEIPLPSRTSADPLLLSGTGDRFGKPHVTGDAVLDILQREAGEAQTILEAKGGRHLCGVQDSESKHQHLSVKVQQRKALACMEQVGVHLWTPRWEQKSNNFLFPLVHTAKQCFIIRGFFFPRERMSEIYGTRACLLDART